jgi:hypothetical protein
MNTESDEFDTLIQKILLADGTTTSYTESSGTCLRAEFQKTTANIGALNISLQIGENIEESTSWIYELEEEDENSLYHVLTEQEAENILQMIEQLEQSAELTDEEKTYYQMYQTLLPEAGAHLGRSEDVSVIYEPKVYTVTIKDVPDYKAVFSYGKDMRILLPAKSNKKNAGSYYLYIIDEKKIKVDNGTERSYQFQKDNLTRLFPTGSYEITREEIEVSTSKSSSSKHSKKSSSTSETTSVSTVDSGQTTSSEKTISADPDTSASLQEDTEEEDSETVIPSVSSPGAVEGTPMTTTRTYSAPFLKTGLWKWVIPAVAALAAALAGGLYMRKKRRTAKMDYEGAPLVDYEIEEDDE